MADYGLKVEFHEAHLSLEIIIYAQNFCHHDSRAFFFFFFQNTKLGYLPLLNTSYIIVIRNDRIVAVRRMYNLYYSEVTMSKVAS